MYTRRRRTGYGLKYYSYQGEHKGNVAGRIVIVFICIVVLFTASIALGNHLRKKAESASVQIAQTITSEAETVTAPSISDGNSITDIERMKNSDQHTAAFFDFSLYEDSDTLTNALLEVAAGSYNAVSLPLTDIYGARLYESDITNLLNRQNNQSEIDNTDAKTPGLASVFTVCSTMELYTIGLWHVDNALFFGDTAAFNAAAYLDSLFIKELSSLGLDEILILGADSSDGDIGLEQICTSIQNYVNVLKTAAPDIAVSVSLSPSYYSDAKSAPYVEQLTSSIDYLTIDISDINDGSDNVFDTIIELCQPLSGSFSLYNLRALISGEELKSSLEALAYCGIDNWQIISTSVFDQDEPLPSE